MKTTVEVKSQKKYYPDLTFDDIKKLVSLMNKGYTEQDAYVAVKEAKK